MVLALLCEATLRASRCHLFKIMKQTLYRFLLTIILLTPMAVSVPGQGGGSINPSTGPASKPPAKPAAKTSPKPSRKTVNATPKSAPRVSTAALDRIDGKWWTVGNGFGDSEVVFTQNGANVSGVIRYADGRTGTITGTLVGKKLQHTWSNSSGDGGTGWLELSWANFLGGPWRNQQVRDGSWVLRRIEGNWCFAGNRSRVRRVTHDERGQLYLVTEDGTREEGFLKGPSIYLTSDYGNVEGEMFYKGNRIDWSTGAYWTWCGR